MNNGHSYGKQPKPGQLFCSDVGKQEPWMTPARFSALFGGCRFEHIGYTEIG